MGNICGKETNDPFSQPGRTLDSAPPAKTTSSVPRKIGGPARTLGGSAPNADAGGSTAQQNDARRRAAEAAEARAKAGKKPAGKLAGQLIEQKKQTRTDTLQEASRDERRMRDADAAAEARVHN